MNFKFIDYAETEEHKMLQETLRKFLSKKLAPIAAGLDEKEEIALDVIKELGQLGFLALMAPEEYSIGGGTSQIQRRIIAQAMMK